MKHQRYLLNNNNQQANTSDPPSWTERGIIQTVAVCLFTVVHACSITLCYKFQKQLTFCCIEKRSLMRDHLRSMTFLSNGLFSLLGIKCIKCILKSISNCLSHWFKFKKFCSINFSIFLLHITINFMNCCGMHNNFYLDWSYIP